MKKLLSLPSNLVESFHDLDPRYADSSWFVASDPADHRLGSGAGTIWLLDRWAEAAPHEVEMPGKRIIIHAGGQSRRLPAYATVGKVLTPIPVFRWAVGQEITQNLLSLQLPLYQQLMEIAPEGMNTLIASGDVCLRSDMPLKSLPQADVVCVGIWADPELTSRHGVFFSRIDTPHTLDFMLQKPSVAELNRLSSTHYYMMDAGLWILSDRAVDLLRRKSTAPDGSLSFYDLYSQFGTALGSRPSALDPELASLSTAIISLPAGEFYHFGTTRELLSSTLALQNKVVDQRLILHRKAKPNPDLFTQNSVLLNPLTGNNSNVWVENSFVAPGWTLTSNNVITGVPANEWQITFEPGTCLDIEPVDTDAYVVRPYGFDDPMRGTVSDPATTFLGISLQRWLVEHNISLPDADADIYFAPLFPVVTDIETMGLLTRWMTSEPGLSEARQLYLDAEKISADQIMCRANLRRLCEQRRDFLREDLSMLAANSAQSIFYQLDLDHLASEMHRLGLDAPEPLPDSAPLFHRMRNRMLRSRLDSHKGLESAATEETEAYVHLRTGILDSLENSRTTPRLDVDRDQIVWGRSPVRIDLAGGWTDTPPYSMLRGGNVVNAAVELNGQPPLQVFIKPCAEPHIVLRSIDLGASEIIRTYDQLTAYNLIGSPFSIPKAALALAGFAPDMSPEKFPTLRSRLRAFGSGMEITLLSAVPAGSGLGTSSILAATVIDALSDFCGLAWDTSEICNRTLALEQLLTTCGGWQDQYGGVLQGVKLLQTDSGWNQLPRTNWLPDGIFTDPAYAPCHLLYYTGITRTAKDILGEIVRKMFLSSGPTISLLDNMRRHALDMAQAIQHRDFNAYGSLLAETWAQNCLLDSGTNPDGVSRIIDRVSDLTLGCKLPGAGGGGFLYMVAKDPEAAAIIRNRLTAEPLRPNARFVNMTISTAGLQVSRS